MRRIVLLLLLLSLLFLTGVYSASAAEIGELLPQKAFWRGTSDGNAAVLLEESEKGFLFYSFVPEKNPSTKTVYKNSLTVPVADHRLVYHIAVQEGGCDVRFLLSDGEGGTVERSLGEAMGKGAVLTKGTYKGALELSKLAEEEALIFTGIIVRLHGKSRVQIVALETMHADNLPEDVSEIESSEEESLAVSEEESSEESESTLSREESRGTVSRDIFVSREDVSFTPAETAATTMFMTGLALLGSFLALFIGVTLFKRTRPHS